MNRIAFLYPGQGAHYAGVLSSARMHRGAARTVLESVDAVAVRRLGKSLGQALLVDRRTTADLLANDPELLQLCIYGVSVAMSTVLRVAGIDRGVHLGHSFGEISALASVGALEVQEGAEVVCDRIEALAPVAGDPVTGMLAVAAPVEAVQALIERFPATQDTRVQVCIAVINHRGQTVLSGEASELDRFAALGAINGMSTRRLDAPCGFHHPRLSSAAARFADRLSHRRFATVAPRSVFSPILGRFYTPGDDLRGALASHLTQPVDLPRAISHLFAAGVDSYVECGAHDALSKSVVRILGPGKAAVFPLLKPGGDEDHGITQLLQHLRTMNISQSETRAPSSNALLAEFESFWHERAHAISEQLKSEFVRFLAQRAAPAPAATAPAPAPVLPVANRVISREALFAQLVAIYAEAMEYPEEVFTEQVELEAELGIDSVKQTEIIQRISAKYALPPLPASFRAGDFKSMGRIVDFVQTQLTRPAEVAVA